MRTECICTAKDGHLCLRCKTKQNSKLDSKTNRCYGIGCSESILDGFGGRVVFGVIRHYRVSVAEHNQDAITMQDIYSHAVTLYDQLPDEGVEDDIIDCRTGCYRGFFGYITPTASKRTPPPKKTKVLAYNTSNTPENGNLRRSQNEDSLQLLLRRNSDGVGLRLYVALSLVVVLPRQGDQDQFFPSLHQFQ